MARAWRRLAAGALVLLGAGCALRPVLPPIKDYRPDDGYRWATRPPLPDNDPGTLLILAFSGGGTRAAAFSFGVLEELRATQVPLADGMRPLLSEVDLMTGVSGGSFTALSYALYGDELFVRYPRDFLYRNVEGELLKRLFDPFTWPRTLSAGFGRSELAEEYYDEILFHGATFADLRRKTAPMALVSATDISTGTRWDFTQGNFNVICSDLDRLRLSRAAAASSAVPVVMSPVTLNNYGGTCGFQTPAWALEATKPRSRAWPGNRAQQRWRDLASFEDRTLRPYIHLVDGGLSGNLALYGIVENLQELESSAAFRGAVGIGKLKRVVVIIVNARSAPSFGYDKRESPPNSLELLMQAINVPIDRYSYESIDALEDVVSEWSMRRKLEVDARRLRGDPSVASELPAIAFGVIDVSFEAVRDPMEREFLLNLPTTLSLPPESIERLRRAAREVLQDSPVYRELIETLAKRP
jgi:NTE family protein